MKDFSKLENDFRLLRENVRKWLGKHDLPEHGFGIMMMSSTQEQIGVLVPTAREQSPGETKNGAYFTLTIPASELPSL